MTTALNPTKSYTCFTVRDMDLHWYRIEVGGKRVEMTDDEVKRTLQKWERRDESRVYR